MKRAVLLVLVLLVGCALFAPVADAAVAAGDPFVVTFKPGFEAWSTSARLRSSYRIVPTSVFTTSFSGIAVRLTAAQQTRLQADIAVRALVPDRRFWIEGTLSGGTVFAQTITPGIQRIKADQSVGWTRNASNTNVAVLDTGIDRVHPDLNVALGANCVDPTALALDDNGHGTAVAGVIAARNNAVGVVGVAPGTKLYSVKIADANGVATLSTMICGLDWVTRMAGPLNIRVANMSLGGSGSNDNNCGNTVLDLLHQAVCRVTAAGVLLVAAAGNDGGDIANYVPAAYPEVLTVTAFTDTDGLAGSLGGYNSCAPTERDDTAYRYSNYGTNASRLHVISAPGVCVLTTAMGGTYDFGTGTSFAAPHVAGAVALCIGMGGQNGVCRLLNSGQLIQRIYNDSFIRSNIATGFTGDPFHASGGRYYGNVLNVVAY